jgi:hypothetical protein
MLALSLVFVLAAHPSPVEAWARKACPPPKQQPDSNTEMKFMVQQRADCLQKAMNKALDKVIVPLKKQSPPSFKEWMGLQADYNRWMAGFYAEAWARKDWKAIQQALEAFSAPAAKARQSLASYRALTQQAAARAPAHVEEGQLPVRQLSKDDWKAYNERLERTASGPEALSKRQCALVPSASADCAQRLADSLAAQLDFSDALSASQGADSE